MTDIFGQSLWPGLALWVALYISDYSLTILCARMYRAQDKIVLEGSYEITPAFQSDVDALRRVSPRFLLAMALSTAALWLMWELTSIPPGWPEAYSFMLGSLIGIQLAIHVRHLRAWFLLRHALASDGVQGHLEYSRTMTLRGSALDLVAFAGVFLVLFVATGSWFILGGAAICAVTARKHYRLAKKHANATAQATDMT